MLNSANAVDYADNIFCKSNFTLPGGCILATRPQLLEAWLPLTSVDYIKDE